MKWLLAAVSVLLSLAGLAAAAAMTLSGIALVGALFTTPLHHEGGLRGTVIGTNVAMPVGPDAVFGSVRVYACHPLSADGRCTPTRQFDVLVGEPLASVQTEDAVIEVDLGAPYDAWRGDYIRRAEVYDAWDEVPQAIRSAGAVEPADGYQLKVLSITRGQAIHVYGEGSDFRVVVGDASTVEATAGRRQLLGTTRWGLAGVTVGLLVITGLFWLVAVLLARRARAMW